MLLLRDFVISILEEIGKGNSAELVTYFIIKTSIPYTLSKNVFQSSHQNYSIFIVANKLLIT